MNPTLPALTGRIQSRGGGRRFRGRITLRSGAPLIIGDHIEDPAMYVHRRYA
jgi:hypothetical protein